MKILMVNKFLYPNGGSKHMFKLGAYLKSIGHEVEYFGMEHEGRCVSNSLDLYTEAMDFHNSSALKKLKLSFKTVYSKGSKEQDEKSFLTNSSLTLFILTTSIFSSLQALFMQLREKTLLLLKLYMTAKLLAQITECILNKKRKLRCMFRRQLF